MNSNCGVCHFMFMYGDIVVAVVKDPYAEDGLVVEWVHERCAPVSERKAEEAN